MKSSVRCNNIEVQTGDITPWDVSERIEHEWSRSLLEEEPFITSTKSHIVPDAIAISLSTICNIRSPRKLAMNPTFIPSTPKCSPTASKKICSSTKKDLTQAKVCKFKSPSLDTTPKNRGKNINLHSEFFPTFKSLNSARQTMHGFAQSNIKERNPNQDKAQSKEIVDKKREINFGLAKATFEELKMPTLRLATRRAFSVSNPLSDRTLDPRFKTQPTNSPKNDIISTNRQSCSKPFDLNKINLGLALSTKTASPRVIVHNPNLFYKKQASDHHVTGNTIQNYKYITNFEELHIQRSLFEQKLEHSAQKLRLIFGVKT